MEQKNNEIDLLDLFKCLTIKIYDFTIRRYKLLGLFIIIGAILGIVISIENKNTYKNTVTAASYIIPPEVMVSTINSLKNSYRTGQTTNQELPNPEYQVTINSIHADTIETVKTMDGQNITTISLNYEFKEGFNQSQFLNCLCACIDSNLYIKEELNLEKQRYNNLINKYSEEIKKLDSLQRKILSANLQSSANQLVNLLVVNDKINNFFHKDILDLEENRQVYLKKMKRLNGLTIINQSAQKKSNLIDPIVTQVLIFFALGLCVSIVLEIRRLVKLDRKDN